MLLIFIIPHLKFPYKIPTDKRVTFFKYWITLFKNKGVQADSETSRGDHVRNAVPCHIWYKLGKTLCDETELTE